MEVLGDFEEEEGVVWEQWRDSRLRVVSTFILSSPSYAFDILFLFLQSKPHTLC